jgi:hypothetical protein
MRRESEKQGKRNLAKSNSSAGHEVQTEGQNCGLTAFLLNLATSFQRQEDDLIGEVFGLTDFCQKFQFLNALTDRQSVLWDIN